MIEADTYRYFHQNGPFPGSAFRYRTREEEAEWRRRDPIDQVAGHLVRRGLLTPEARDAAVAGARSALAAAGEVLLEPLPGGKPGERRIKPGEWPDPAFADVGVRGDLSEFSGVRVADDAVGTDEQRREVAATAGARLVEIDGGHWWLTEPAAAKAGAAALKEFWAG